MTKITTKQYTRIDHNGLHVECSDILSPAAKWRTCVNHKTAEHVPPSFTAGIAKEDIRRLRDLCATILENVYDEYH